MKITAARVHDHNKPLVVEEFEIGEPSSDEVLVDLVFAGVNPIDRYTAAGTVSPDFPTPRVAGSEASGLVGGKPVVANGAGLGSMRDGVFATAALVPKKAVVPVPNKIDLAEAACLGVAGVTAWNVVHETARVTKNDRVVVLGAGGGVGLAIVSLLKSVGAETWGQVGREFKADSVLKAGASNVVVADSGSLTEQIKSFRPTVVIDPLGGNFTGAAVKALVPQGRVAIFGTSAGAEATFPLQLLYRSRLSLLGYGGLALSEEERRASVENAAEAVAARQMTIPIGKVMPLSEVNEAFETLANRDVVGKIVLDLH